MYLFLFCLYVVGMSCPVEAASFLRPRQKETLQRAGVMYVDDLAHRSPDALAACCAMPLEECKAVVDAAHRRLSQPLLMPLELVLEQEGYRENVRLATFSRDLDVLLGGGVQLGHLTEVCGAPGAGKTQIAMQLGVSCFLPKSFGGAGGASLGCLYIDTEGSFVGSRFREIASAAVAQVTRIANQQRWVHTLTPQELEQMRSDAAAFTVDAILQGTRLIRVVQLADFLSVIHALPELIAEDSGIRCVVIDSVAFPFRSSGADALQTFRMVYHTGQLLQRLCRDHHIGVVATNHMTTKVHPQDGGQRVSELVPALGDSWAHLVGTRLVIRAPPTPTVTFSADGASQQRFAELRKSPTEPRGECSFIICGAGVRNALVTTQ